MSPLRSLNLPGDHGPRLASPSVWVLRLAPGDTVPGSLCLVQPHRFVAYTRGPGWEVIRAQPEPAAPPLPWGSFSCPQLPLLPLRHRAPPRRGGSPADTAPGKQARASQLRVSIASREKSCLLAAPILAAAP